MDDPKNLPVTGSRKPSAPRTGEGIKDTLESILIAFVLAFVFRAFVVEAFVIPSGSMAPTLLGAHMSFRCEACGYHFTTNFPTVSDREGGEPKIAASTGAVLSIKCPNCGYPVPRENLREPAQSASDTPMRYGDRILVLKYLYLLQEPQRWDVVVFKTPTMGDYATNFIKRLVGRPGETVMLLDGDVYVVPNEQAPGLAAQLRSLEQSRDPDWVDRLVALSSRQPWQVQTKPAAAQRALWRVVYDNDYPPEARREEFTWHQPWRQREGQGWLTQDEGGPRRVFEFGNLEGSGTLAFDKDANPATRNLTDFLAYNQTGYPTGPNHDAYSEKLALPLPLWHVSDVKLQFSYMRHEGDGPLRLKLTKLGYAFMAELHGDHVRLLHQRPGESQFREIGRAAMALPAGRWADVQFVNADYRVTLQVDGRDLLQTTPQQYAPDVQDLLRRHYRRQVVAKPEDTRQVFPPPTVEMAAERQRSSVAHLSLWRDVYYTPRSGYPAEIQWGRPANPITLASRSQGAAEDEYFVLGDNSILSSDARVWDQAVDLPAEDLHVAPGRVPGRFLLGKAFFVYWPAGYRPWGVRSLPGLVPNFGELRFIH